MTFFNCARKLGISVGHMNMRGTFIREHWWLRSLVNLKLNGQYVINKKFSTCRELSLTNLTVKKYLDHVVSEYKKIKEGHSSSLNIDHLKVLNDLLDRKFEIVENIKNLEELGKHDKEMKSLAEDEQLMYKVQLARLDEDLLNTILMSVGRDNSSNVLLEVSAGVGGQEAMLFAKDLWDMYLGHFDRVGFNYNILECNVTNLGGIRCGSISISGERAFETLRHEGGVHRVQRVPVTEQHGKLQTSTVTVVVLQEPTEIEIVLNDKDLRIETKRSSGAGGQHVNTTDSCVRITHLPTGISCECQTGRSQVHNKKIALLKLRTEIYKEQLNKQMASVNEIRKKQMGMGFRNEKIRTYNFQQDRITDHRLTSGSVHNLEEFLEGGIALQRLQEKLQLELQKSILFHTIKDLENSST